MAAEDYTVNVSGPTPHGSVPARPASTSDKVVTIDRWHVNPTDPIPQWIRAVARDLSGGDYLRLQELYIERHILRAERAAQAPKDLVQVAADGIEAMLKPFHRDASPGVPAALDVIERNTKINDVDRQIQQIFDRNGVLARPGGVGGASAVSDPAPTSFPRRVGDHFDDMTYNPNDGQWHLTSQPFSWLGSIASSGGILGAIAALLASLIMALTTPDCALVSSRLPQDASGPTQSDAKNGATTGPPDASERFDVGESDGAVKAADVVPPADWEGRLKNERLRAAAEGDTDKFNRLIKEHLQVYVQRAVDPCQAGFFPEGCR